MFACIESDAKAIWHCLLLLNIEAQGTFALLYQNLMCTHHIDADEEQISETMILFNQFSTRVIILEKISVSSRRYFGHVVTSHPYCDPNRKGVADIDHTKRRNVSCLAALGRNWPCRGQYLSCGLLEFLTVNIALWKIMTAWKRGQIESDAPFGNKKRECKDQCRSSCS